MRVVQMTMETAETLALTTLKQVIEEKVSSTNVEIASVRPALGQRARAILSLGVVRSSSKALSAYIAPQKRFHRRNSEVLNYRRRGNPKHAKP